MNTYSEDGGSIEHCLNGSMLYRSQITQRDFFAVTKCLCARVKKNFHGVTIEYLQGQLIAHGVDRANCSPNYSASTLRQVWQRRQCCKASRAFRRHCPGVHGGSTRWLDTR